jgi:hypothetical protein
MHLFVDAQPSFLFIGGQQIHDLREICNYVLSDFFNESTSFFGDFHKNFAAVVRSVRTLNVAKILQTIYQARGCGGRVVHLFRDFAHGQKVVSGNVTEKKKLGKRDLPSGEFFRQAEHQTALKHHHDVRKPFHIGTDFRSLQFDHDY